MDPPAGDAAPPPAAAAAAAPGSALAGASREQLAKALERSARKLKAADERATNAEAAAERAVAESERLAKERDALVEKERSRGCIRGALGRGGVDARLDGGDARRRARAFVGERARRGGIRAGGSRDRARGVVPGVRLRDGDHGGVAGDLRGARLDARRAGRQGGSSSTRRAPSSRRDAFVGRGEEEGARRFRGDQKEDDQDSSRRRETLEAEVRAERTKRVETESKLETRLLEITTELSDAKQSMTAAKDRETEYRARAASLLASKDARISNLLEEKKNASSSRGASVEGNANDSLSSVTRNTHGEEEGDDRTNSAAETETETETEKETIRRLRRETIELRAALNDARLLF